MAARNHQIVKEHQAAPLPVLELQATHAIADPETHDPVESPALLLQNALRETRFDQPRPASYYRLSRVMLALSLVCVYTVTVLMITGRLAG